MIEGSRCARKVSVKDEKHKGRSRTRQYSKTAKKGNKKTKRPGRYASVCITRRMNEAARSAQDMKTSEESDCYRQRRSTEGADCKGTCDYGNVAI